MYKCIFIVSRGAVLFFCYKSVYNFIFVLNRDLVPVHICLILANILTISNVSRETILWIRCE